MSEPGTKIVLHIGAEKTGTSSLQATLAKNAAALLAEAGLLYPRNPPLAAGNAHFGIAAAFLDADRSEFFVPGGRRSPAELRQNPTLPDSPPVTSLIGEAESATIMSCFAETNGRLAEKHGVAFAPRRNGPQRAVRIEPLEPALVEFLAVQLREIERRDIANARGRKSGPAARLGALLRIPLRILRRLH